MKFYKEIERGMSAKQASKILRSNIVKTNIIYYSLWSGLISLFVYPILSVSLTGSTSLEVIVLICFVLLGMCFLVVATGEYSNEFTKYHIFGIFPEPYKDGYYRIEMESGLMAICIRLYKNEWSEKATYRKIGYEEKQS